LGHTLEILVLVDVNATQILPGTGRGTIRRIVEGALVRRCARWQTPSVSRCAAATFPSWGGLFELRKAARDHIVALAVVGIGRLTDRGGLHQVQAAELLALLADMAEDFGRRRVGDTREGPPGPSPFKP